MRHLASIKTVASLQPIEGRDRIELAHIDGWQVIVKKGEFAIGDKCVYVEIDSRMPEKPEFEFLRSKKFLIRTMKMAGVVSQGICFPLSILPEGNWKPGDDVTETIGVTKYEPYEDAPQPREPKAEKSWFHRFMMRFRWYRTRAAKIRREREVFPEGVSKTEETRIQNMPEILLNHTKRWCATEKIDGTSATYVWKRKTREFIVCSRNRRLYSNDGSVYWRIAEALELKKTLRHLQKTSYPSAKMIVLQGEIIGPSIQGNKYKVSVPRFYAFNLIVDGVRRASPLARKILEREGIPFVPIVAESVTLPETVEEVLKEAHGQSAIGDTLREGLVYRSGGTDSFKAVDPEFLLYYNI